MLGPLLFIIYTTPLNSVLSKAKEIKHHLYADDTRVHNSFNTSSFKKSTQNVQNSLVSVQHWMYKNKLKLNPDKTEFLLIGNKCHRKNFTSTFPIDILGNQISPKPTARNMGVLFDSDFNFIPHINSIVKSCNYNICQFRHICKHLDQDTTISVANTIIGSRIDYCTYLLYGVHNTYVKKLQRVQNSLAYPKKTTVR